jgi:hypothetical protein
MLKDHVCPFLRQAGLNASALPVHVAKYNELLQRQAQLMFALEQQQHCIISSKCFVSENFPEG